MGKKILAPERKYAVDTLSQYWLKNVEWVYQLPIFEVVPQTLPNLPPRMQYIEIPDWAKDVGVDGKLLVPRESLKSVNETSWNQVDWFSAIFWYLNGSAERAYEKTHGPIHSNCFRLKSWDPRIWDRAWVNRIALFLRRWVSKIKEIDEEKLFGPLPIPQIILTHDVDAVRKTLAIRLKQTAVHLLHSAHNLSEGQGRKSKQNISKAKRFLFSQGDYWCFDKIMEMEKQYGMRSHFNFYGGPGGAARSFKEQVFDPAYNVLNPRIKNMLRELNGGGWKIGLHPAFDSWKEPKKLRLEKEQLEDSLGCEVEICRQHWLRFGWEDTWQAQASAGFKLDTTLGFNDRPGFRNGMALKFNPWDSQQRKPMDFSAIPMVLMDSQLFDHKYINDEDHNKIIKHWLDEVILACGTATIIWHQRVMSPDYGWGSGYQYLLSYIQKHSLA